jgi:uncharacterized protein YndB with AHSA1/START domain
MSANENSDREIVTTRVFDAPRELVWEVSTKPEHVAHWFGPNGFTLTIHEMNVSNGGVWRFIMHGPDGTDYPNRIDFVEVVQPERLVYEHGNDSDVDPIRFHVTMTFEDLGNNQTRLTSRMVFPTAEQRTRVIVENGALEGAEQHLNRLGDYLSKMEASHV